MGRTRLILAALVTVVLSSAYAVNDHERIVLSAGPGEVMCPCSICEGLVPQLLTKAVTHLVLYRTLAGLEAAAERLHQLVQSGLETAPPARGACQNLTWLAHPHCACQRDFPARFE